VVELTAALELICRFLLSFQTPDFLETLAHRAYLFAEVLFVVLPVFAFFTLRPGTLGSFLRRPHLLALVWAGATALVASFTAAQIESTYVLSTIAYRVLGMKLYIPGKTPLYIVSLFFGTLLVGSLILPSKRWPPDSESRRIGTGLGCIWLAGIQPTHPYQFILMLTGFLYLSRGLLDSILKEEEPLITTLSSVARSD
jgi:hypothetical protein